MNNCGIYKISSPSGFYIGSSKKIDKRKQDHFSALRANRHCNTMLQRAFKKYGDLIKFSVIEFCSFEELLEREQFYIDSLTPKYNICRIAGRMDGYKFTEEQKEKMRGRKVDGNKIREGMLRNTTKEQRIEQSKRARSMWTENSKRSCAEKRKLYKATEETRRKISKSLTGRPVSAETRLKLSMQKGWKHSDVSKQKMSIASKGKTGILCPNSKKIQCSNGMIFFGAKEAERWLRENGFPKAHAGRITAVCRGERNKTYSMTWSYIE